LGSSRLIHRALVPPVAAVARVLVPGERGGGPGARPVWHGSRYRKRRYLQLQFVTWHFWGGCRRARGYPSGHRSPLSHAAAGETLRPLSRAAALLRSARVRPTPRRCDKPFVMGNPHNKPRQDHKQIIFSSYYDYRCQPASGSGASTVRRGRGGGGRISLAVARALLPATFAGRERTHTPEGRQYRFDSSLAPNVLPVAAASYSKLTPFPRCVSSCVQATNAWHWVRARRSSEGPSG
jgi:hypothetical protein